jgi:hypothetical protein
MMKLKKFLHLLLRQPRQRYRWTGFQYAPAPTVALASKDTGEPGYLHLMRLERQRTTKHFPN